jgi:hypothetical protein
MRLRYDFMSSAVIGSPMWSFREFRGMKAQLLPMVLATAVAVPGSRTSQHIGWVVRELPMPPPWWLIEH